MYFLPRRLTYCSQILSNCNVPVVASSTGDPAGFLLSVSSSRRLSACLRPTTQKGEETLLVRPRTTYWASRTSSERVDQAPGKPAEPDNIIIRGRSAEKQAIPCLKSNQIITGRTTWTNAYNILIRFTLKRRGLFKDGVNSDQSLVWAE